MKRSDLINVDSNCYYDAELIKKSAIHEAGHAAAIYLLNKRQQLPPVFFRICLPSPFIEPQAFYQSSAYIEGGRLIHTLPLSIENQFNDFSVQQQHAYSQAFDADIINLLAGPLAEAKYIALRDKQLFSADTLSLEQLAHYGGQFDLATVQEYLCCLSDDACEQTKKGQALFLAAFNFVNDALHWAAIVRLANYISEQGKLVIDCEEAIAVLDAS